MGEIAEAGSQEGEGEEDDQCKSGPISNVAQTSKVRLLRSQPLFLATEPAESSQRLLGFHGAFWKQGDDLGYQRDRVMLLTLGKRSPGVERS